MAVSAFKSTSKRGNLGTSVTNIPSSSSKESNSDSLNKKITHRRSRSVSAFSRNYSEIPNSSSSPSSSTVDFLNKRDNPLFSSSSPSPPKANESENVIRIAKLDENASKTSKMAPKLLGSGGVLDSRRGRSVSRSSNSPNRLSGSSRREMGRSLSRVDMGRRQRSLSRTHYGNSESEVEQEYSLSSSFRNKNNWSLASNLKKKSNVVTTASELSQPRTLQTWSSQHRLLEPSDSCLQASNCGDGVSSNSFSEAEEKTIKAVFEQMKSDHPAGDADTAGIYETVRSEVRHAIAEIRNDLENAIRRNNSTIITTANVVDIPPELVNPDAVELVLDIRKEYARKLEQSQERAKKLQADLAVEEHRAQEFRRILKEILPDPKTSDMQKSRSRRKTSAERRKMSKRLTTEAMNYFDECVSISTFDSSDFSAPEDPPLNLFAASSPIGERSSSASTAYCSDGNLYRDKESDNVSSSGSGLRAMSSSKDATNDQDRPVDTNVQPRNFRFSFASEPTETLGLPQDIRNYVKKFEKEIQKDGVNSQIARSNYYDVDDYKLQATVESLLFDRVIFRNRIESGSLLLCGGGIII